MALGQGYWLSPTGEIIEIYEHLNYVTNHLSDFGLTPESIMFTEDERALKQKGPAANRERILRDVIRRGWIRIRRAPSMTMSFETWRTTDEAMFRIGEAIQAAHLADRGENIRINSVRDETSELVNVGDLLAGRVFSANPEDPGFLVATFTPQGELYPTTLDFLARQAEEWRKKGVLSMFVRDQTALKVTNYDADAKLYTMDKRLFAAWAQDWAQGLSRKLKSEVMVDVA